MKFTIDDSLTDEQLAVIDEQRKRDIHEVMRAIPEESRVVQYLGREYLVFRRVFPPSQDSMPLVNNYRIDSGERVLDFGTGSGVLAIESALRGAGFVFATDINPTAVMNATINADRHNVENIVLSDCGAGCFDKKDVPDWDRFDVITANLPFLDRAAEDYVELSTFDEGFSAHTELFTYAQRVLKQEGRMYIAQANFGNPEKMIAIAEGAGFNVELIGRARDTEMPEKVYYAFECRRRGE